MWRNAGDYVKRSGAALIRGAATNAEFTVVAIVTQKSIKVRTFRERNVQNKYSQICKIVLSSASVDEFN